MNPVLGEALARRGAVRRGATGWFIAVGMGTAAAVERMPPRGRRSSPGEKRMPPEPRVDHCGRGVAGAVNPAFEAARISNGPRPATGLPPTCRRGPSGFSGECSGWLSTWRRVASHRRAHRLACGLPGSHKRPPADRLATWHFACQTEFRSQSRRQNCHINSNYNSLQRCWNPASSALRPVTVGKTQVVGESVEAAVPSP